LKIIEIQEGNNKAILTSEEIHKPRHSHKITTTTTGDAAETILSRFM